MNKLLLCHLCTTAVLGALAAACSPSFDHLDFSPQTSPPLAVTLTSTEVRLPAGIAVDVAPVAMAGTKALTDSTVTITSTNAAVLGIAPTAGKSNNFVMFGVGPGTAGVVVTVDGDQKETIPVVVSAQ
jgi:hypothetical protein